MTSDQKHGQFWDFLGHPPISTWTVVRSILQVCVTLAFVVPNVVLFRSVSDLAFNHTAGLPLVPWALLGAYIALPWALVLAVEAVLPGTGCTRRVRLSAAEVVYWDEANRMYSFGNAGCEARELPRNRLEVRSAGEVHVLPRRVAATGSLPKWAAPRPKALSVIDGQVRLVVDEGNRARKMVPWVE